MGNLISVYKHPKEKGLSLALFGGAQLQVKM